MTPKSYILYKCRFCGEIIEIKDNRILNDLWRIWQDGGINRDYLHYCTWEKVGHADFIGFKNYQP